MKNAIALMALVLSTSAFSAQADVRENGGFLVPAAAQIEFFSPGNGIDRNLKAAIDALIQEYKNADLVQSHTETGMGMEGEVTVCVQLKELDPSRELNQKIIDLVNRGQRKTNLKFVSSCVVEKINGPFRRRN